MVLAVDVRGALAALPEDDRRLLLARYWADMTQSEVANLLGMPDGTAKVRLHRLRAPPRLRPTLRGAMRPVTRIDDPRYVKAMSHPLRVRILAILEERKADRRARPGARRRPGDRRLPRAHAGPLGLIELVDETRVRGAVEHHYRARERPVVTAEGWEQAPPIAKQAASALRCR